jgi:hypothetical protein
MVLLRMYTNFVTLRHGRARLLSPSFWKGLLRRRVLNDIQVAGNVAQRFSLLGGAGMLRAKLEGRPARMPSAQVTLSGEREIAARDRS